MDLFDLSETELREKLTKSAEEHGISETEVEKVITAVLSITKTPTTDNDTTLTTTKRDEEEEEKIGEDGVVGGKSRKSRKGRKGGRKTRRHRK